MDSVRLDQPLHIDETVLAEVVFDAFVDLLCKIVPLIPWVGCRLLNRRGVVDDMNFIRLALGVVKVEHRPREFLGIGRRYLWRKRAVQKSSMTRTGESEGRFLRFQPSLMMPLIHVRQAFRCPTPSSPHPWLVRPQPGEPCETSLACFLTGAPIHL